jgi:hypothetical protein
MTPELTDEQKLVDVTWQLAYISYALPNLSSKKRVVVFSKISKLWSLVK